MSKIIGESVYQKEFEKRTDKPLASILIIKESIRKFGEINVVNEDLSSSQTGANISTKIEVSKSTDGITFAKFDFIIEYVFGVLNIDVSAYVVAKIESKDETFNSFYMKESYPEMLSKARQYIKKACLEIETRIEEM